MAIASAERQRCIGVAKMMHEFAAQSQASNAAQLTLINAMVETETRHHEAILSLGSGTQVLNHLRENGISPYLVDPGARVQADIQEVMSNLGMDREHAIEYINRQLE